MRMVPRNQSWPTFKHCCILLPVLWLWGLLAVNMVYLRSQYLRSAVDLLAPPQRSFAVRHKPCCSWPRLTSLPPAVIDLILSSLAPADLAPLLNTSRSLRSHASARIAVCRQQALARVRSLQHFSVAANLPNELLQEIFARLDPVDFYNCTRTCSVWRSAGSYTTLVARNIAAITQAQSPAAAAAAATATPPPPPGGRSADGLEALALHLRRAGQLWGGAGTKGARCAVSTLYCRNPANPLGRVFSNDSGYGAGAAPAADDGGGSSAAAAAAAETAYPDIHLSEDGHYFLAVETVFPFRAHVYCTYRAVLDGDTAQCCSWFGDSNPAAAAALHAWDATPTYLLTLPERGRVVSASFGAAVRGGVEYDRRTRSYSKGLDLLVLFQGRQAHLYKIRQAGRKTKSSAAARRGLAERLFGWMTPGGGRAAVECGAAQKWVVWDSMVFEGVCSSQQGATKAKLGERSENAFFAGAGALEVWEGINVMAMSAASKNEVWNKGAATKRLAPLPQMPGKVASIHTGKIWDSSVGADVDYIICSNTAHDTADGRRASGDEAPPSRAPAAPPIPTYGTAIITPTLSMTFNYASFAKVPGPGSPQFICLSPPHKPSHLQLYPILSPQSSPLRDIDTLSLRTKSELGCPTTSSLSKVTHIAAINAPALSPPGPIAVAATDSGVIYISASSSSSFRKIATIPPDTGGRITDLRISYREPVWASPRRSRLLPEDAALKPRAGGVVAVVVATDRGRIEVCYFDFDKQGDGKSGLGRSGAGKRWDLSGERVASIEGVTGGK